MWHVRSIVRDRNPNIDAVIETIESLGEALRARLAAGVDPGRDRALYQAVAVYLLYNRVEPDLSALIQDDQAVARARSRLAAL